MYQREKYENGIFSVRFVGDALGERGVSIYDLGTYLVTMQRIVHKAFLSSEDRLKKSAFPTKDEREKLALQLGERRRTSDGYALVPILTDPNVQEMMKFLANYVFEGLVGYFLKDVLGRLAKERSEEKRIFINSIHADVVNIVGRIDAAGGVAAINIGSPALEKETLATFSEENKQYIQDLSKEYFLGNNQELVGKVYRLYPDSKIVTIRREDLPRVSVFLEQKEFDKIRFHQGSHLLAKFFGRPRHKFGADPESFEEFEAYRVSFPRAAE